MFRNLCGAKNYKNVVVLTTFWDKVTDKKEGIQREEQLKSKFFKELVDGGAGFMRYDRTIKSARRVLRHIFTLVPTNVQIQHEIRVEGKSLEDTAAGSVHREEVERIIAKHKEELAEVRAEMANMMAQNAAFRKELEAERARVRQNLARWDKEKSELKNGLVEVRSDRVRLEAEVVTQKKNHEQSCQDQESEWSSHFDSRARAHDVAVRDLQDHLDQENKTRQEIERRTHKEAERITREEAEKTRKTRARMETDRVMREEEMKRIQRDQGSVLREAEEMVGREQDRMKREMKKREREEERQREESMEERRQEERRENERREEVERIVREEAKIRATEMHIRETSSPPPPYAAMQYGELYLP